MKNLLILLALWSLATPVEFTPQARAADKPRHKVLFFSKSSGFEHPMIKRKAGDEMSSAEKILADLGPRHNVEFTFTKDGSLFTPENIAKYDAFFFYTTGDLTTPGNDKNPPMTVAGKAAFLQAIHNGKGFIGTHSATDTFHSPGNEESGPARYLADGDRADPYVKMIGAEFIIHGAQQASRMIPIDPKFPGIAAVKPDFAPPEEWYALKNFAPDLHVLLLQDTQGMKGEMYQRAAYPATWAHKYGRGRVFYTSMGHRDDVWTNPVFQTVLFGGIEWVLGDAKANIAPNIRKVAPHADETKPQAASKPAH